MLKQSKQYILIGLCIALLHSTLFSSSTNTTEQQTTPKTENAEQLQDEKQLVENQEKKPTILASWRKVITLKWKTLTKTDVWNISKSITAIGAIGLLCRYLVKKDITDVNAHDTDLYPNPTFLHKNAIGVVEHSATMAEPTEFFNWDFSSHTDSDIEIDNLNASEDDPDLKISCFILLSDHIEDITDIHAHTSDLYPNPNLFNKNVVDHDVVEHSAITAAPVKFFNDHFSSHTDSDTEIDDSSDSEDDSSLEILNPVPSNNNINGLLDNLNSKTCCMPYTDNIHPLMLSAPIRRRNIACFFDYDVLPDDPQHLIALYMISDFLVPPITMGNKNKIFSTIISPDNTRIVSAIPNNNAKIWSPYNQEFYILKGHTRLILSIAISPNNAYVITGSCDNTAKIWDMYTGQLKHTYIGHASPINFITISYDNKYMTTCSQDMVVKKWHIETGQLLETLKGYTHYCNSLVLYCSDKVNALSGLIEGTTRLTNMATSKTQHTIIEPLSTIRSTAISQDKAYVVISLSDSTLKIIPLQMNLQEQELNTFSWIKHNILPRQAHLIVRACAATQAKNVFVINSTSDDVIAWVSFPAYVRYYLRSRLNIQLKK